MPSAACLALARRRRGAARIGNAPHKDLVHLVAGDGDRLVGEAGNNVRRERVVAQVGPKRLAG
jgi:hypothetical protein